MSWKWDGAMLKQGVRGSSVTLLQETLNGLGYSVGKADGDFGGATQRALAQFQSENQLGADGVLGRKTAEALDSAVAKQAKQVALKQAQMADAKQAAKQEAKTDAKQSYAAKTAPQPQSKDSIAAKYAAPAAAPSADAKRKQSLKKSGK